MRQGQQNRRGRGRQNNGGHSSSHQTHNQSNNNNNRKGQNPLARSYESNGPDVKIRGNPAHIAEKYTTLARDAQTSGDSVLAEAYLQYAEHYNRIIMAYREQQGEGAVRPRVQNEGLDGNSDQGGDEDGDDLGQGSEASIRGQEPQPGMFDQPGGRSADQPVREDRGNRDEQRPQRGYDDRQPRRNDGNNRNDGNRNDGNRNDGNRDGGRRDRYGEAPRGYNSNRDDRRERFDRNQGPDRNNDRSNERGPDRGNERGNDRGSNDRPTQDRGYQERPNPDRQGQDRQSQDRGYQERPSSDRQDRPSADRPSYDRPVTDRVSVERSVVEQAPVEFVPAPVVEADVAPAPVREAPVPRRRAAAAAPAVDRFVEGSQEQPEFLRRPVRRPRREAVPAADAVETPPPAEPPVKGDL